MTTSEQLFDGHCKGRDVICDRLEEGTEKVADFAVSLGSETVYAEVKQLDRNEKDHLIRKRLDAGDCVGGVAPTKRVRVQIARAYKQLKQYSDDPCLIVLYNNAGIFNHIDGFTVTSAMFGDYAVRVELNADRVIHQTGQGFRGNRKLTRNTCRGISAICILEEVGDRESRLNVYHNPFALRPITPWLINGIADAQYRHDDPHTGKFVPLNASEIGT